MKFLLSVLLFCFTTTFSALYAQGVQIIPGNDTSICTNQTLPLTASIDPVITLPPGTAFSGYETTTIPLAALPLAGTPVVLPDDGFGGPYPIGFTFNFYNNNYNQFFISPNGWIGFTQPLSGTFSPPAGGIPNCNTNVPYNGILGVWQDFNPAIAGGPYIFYQTTGAAPNRVLTVSFSNIPFFGATCPGQTSTFQFQLYETTNIVQVHIVNKPQCAGMWSGQIYSGVLAPVPVPCDVNAPTCNNYAYQGGDIAINNTAWQYQPITGNTTITGTLQSLQWSVNGGNVGQANNPNYTAFMTSTTQNRTVVLSATFAVPCIGNIVVRDTVIISPRPYDATFSVTSPICAGGEESIITFEGNPVPNATATVTWNFDGGTAAPGTGLGPHNVNWNTNGEKNVSLTISGGSCATGTFSTTVDVVPSPVSDFSATPVVCGVEAADVIYEGNAPANATYTWDFDGGTATGSGQGPYEVTWNTPGSKSITLQVSIGSCISTVSTNTVVVNPASTSTFSAAPTSVCVGEASILTYSGTGLASSTYTWNFDGAVATPAAGQGPISLVWNTPGTKTVTLNVDENACLSSTTEVEIIVKPIPTSLFTVSPSVCPGDNATVTYTGSAPANATFNWDFDGGSATPLTGIGPFQVNWANSGTKEISLTVVQQGCSSTETNQNTTVNENPTASFISNTPDVCVGESATLTFNGVAGAGSTYTWSSSPEATLIGGNAATQQISWSSSGTKTVSLIVNTNGCISPEFTLDVIVNPTPSANFTVSNAVCPDADATLTYTGSGTLGATYTFNYGLGATSNPIYEGNPILISWSTSGSKTISLIVEENGCASQPFTQTVTVYDKPSSTFTALSPICAGQSSQINYTGDAANSDIFNWSFSASGNPSASNTIGPHTVSFANAGTYTIGLTVSKNGCFSDPNEVSIVVNPIPSSTFNLPAQVCLNSTAQIQYSGNAPATSIFNWNFGDAITTGDFGAGPYQLNWSSVGQRTVTLSVVSLGCTSVETSTQINVLDLPDVVAGEDKLDCSGAQIEIGLPNNPAYLYSWTPTVGVAEITQAQTTVQLFNNTLNPQTYQYILSAYDGQCFNYDSIFVTVTAPPQVSFAVPPGQCFDGNTFSFTAEGEFSETAQFSWTFPEAASIAESNELAPSNITFDTAGVQTITLQVDDSGCFSNLFTANVVVYPQPSADFEASVLEGCAPLQVNFTNESEGSELSFEWSFGNGAFSTSANPKYIYTNSGLYDVSLLIRSAFGCVSQLNEKDLILVHAVPNGNFSMNFDRVDILKPEVIVSSYAGNLANVIYEIEDVDTLLGPNQVILLPDTGNYLITHIAYNGFGCADTSSRNIKVITGYRFYVPNSFTPNFDGNNDLFQVYGEDIRDFHIRIFNRWGHQVYESYDVESGWDGYVRLSNDPAPEGAYVYTIEVIDKRAQAYSYSGQLFLIR